MVDSTGVNFNDAVIAYTFDMFSSLPSSGTFSLVAGATPGQINLSSPDTPILTDGTGSALIATGTVTQFGGGDVTFTGGSAAEVETSWDFTAPDGNTYWVAEIREDSNSLYVSNYNFASGETYSVVGMDDSPGISGDTYDSAYGEGNTSAAGGQTGLRVDEIATPNSPLLSGGVTYQAFSGADVTVGGTITIAAGASSGTFTSFDNDNFFSDANASYTLPQADLNQIGSASVGDSNNFTNSLFQAETAFNVQDSVGNNFVIIQIRSQSGATIYVATSPMAAGESYTVTSTDGAPGYSNGIAAEIAPQYNLLAVCFTAKTRIATSYGDVETQDLVPGDLVHTMDHGLQPVRWIGSRKVRAIGKLAPIVIKAGALGNARDLKVSPQHRMLFSGSQAELMFGEEEVLACAKHLVNGDTIYIEEGGEVEYFHILFDRHEIIFAEGAPSESFHPGAEGLSTLDEEAREEILTLFPELRENVGAVPAARLALKGFEANLLNH